MLQETRMILFEKVGQDDVVLILSHIDNDLIRRRSLHIGIDAYIPDSYVFKEWFKNNKVRKVLEDNGFEIFENFDNERSGIGYIRHRKYYELNKGRMLPIRLIFR